MLPEILRRYDDTVLHEALQRAGISADDAVPLGGFEAHVFKLPGQILKITHTLRRTAEYIRGELDFVEHLAARGVTLPQPIPFYSGRRVEVLPDSAGGAFLAYRFEAAPGAPTRYPDWTDTFIETWGATAGHMVRAGQDFVPASPARQRQEWHQDPMLDLAACLPAARADSIARGQALIQRLRARAWGPQEYGLTHADLHHGNFFRDDAGRLLPFDFDDCEYGPVAREVSIPLHYALSALPSGVRRAEFGEHFLVQFVRGFRQEHPLGSDQIRLLPDLLLLRTVILASVLHTSVFPDAPADARRPALLEVFHRRIGGEPVLDLDFGRLAEALG